MKLKTVHQNPEMKAEQNEEQQIVVSPHDEDDNNSQLLAPTPISALPLLLSGKRKRKPKEIYDEGSPIIRRRNKKKKSTASKSQDGTHDTRGTLTSKEDTSIALKSPTLIRAEEFQSSLGNNPPSFIKVLVRSHVSSCFWMGLPVPFCKIHLPSEDVTVILEDENGEEFSIKYIAHKTGLSAGWRKFVTGNKLVEGDVLIYQLIGPCRFKVYIIRANDLTELDGALSLLILDSQTKQTDADETIGMQIKKKKHRKSLQNRHNEIPLGPENGQPEENSENDSDDVASEVFEGTKFSGSCLNFKDIKSFDEFHIIVNGVCIDSELPEKTRRKYYDLCCSKNAYLHDHILPGLYSKLTAGIIFETIIIADAIRGCNITTPREDFEVWEKSVRSFQLLGLNVGFLRAHLRRLINLAFDSECAFEIRRYWEAQKDQSRTMDEIKKLEAKLVELKELSVKYDRDLEDLKAKADRYEVKFLEEVNAPW